MCLALLTGYSYCIPHTRAAIIVDYYLNLNPVTAEYFYVFLSQCLHEWARKSSAVFHAVFGV